MGSKDRKCWHVLKVIEKKRKKKGEKEGKKVTDKSGRNAHLSKILIIRNKIVFWKILENVWKKRRLNIKVQKVQLSPR